MPEKVLSSNPLASTLLVIITFLVGAIAFSTVAGAQTGRPVSYAEKSLYQAVFLANGQVYFGKITKQTPEMMVLENIYYLQINAPIQGQQAASASDLALVKLGNELHGPTDAMYIQRNQVLFYENLKDDSRVVQAIKNYAGSRQ